MCFTLDRVIIGLISVGFKVVKVGEIGEIGEVGVDESMDYLYMN